MAAEFTANIEIGGGILDQLIGITHQVDITQGASGGPNHAMNNLVAANMANYQNMIG